jgi:hypothetical protein
MTFKYDWLGILRAGIGHLQAAIAPDNGILAKGRLIRRWRYDQSVIKKGAPISLQSLAGALDWSKMGGRIDHVAAIVKVGKA